MLKPAWRALPFSGDTSIGLVCRTLAKRDPHTRHVHVERFNCYRLSEISGKAT